MLEGLCGWYVFYRVVRGECLTDGGGGGFDDFDYGFGVVVNDFGDVVGGFGDVDYSFGDVDYGFGGGGSIFCGVENGF